MDSSPIGSPDDQTYHLIRLPKESVERAKNGGTNSVKVGTVNVYRGGRAEFVDDESLKEYSLMRNIPIKGEPVSGGHKRANCVSASEESDLFRISLQKKEAVHLGKVMPLTLLAVPRVDETNVSTAFD